MIRYIAFLNLFLLGFAVVQNPVRAAVRQDSANILNTFVREAVRNNPQIKSAEMRWRARRERAPQVSSLDDPTFSYTRWLSSVETRVGPQKNVFALSQRFPFFGKLSLKGKMANQDALVAREEYRASLRDVIFKVKRAYYDLYWIDQSLQILARYQQLLQDFQRVTERQYATGVGIQANVLKARLEISSIQRQRLNFRQMRQVTAAHLNALLARERDSEVPEIGVIDTSLVSVSEPELIQTALRNREELKAAQAMIQKSEYSIRFSRREYLPDLDLSFRYVTVPDGKTLAADNGKDAWSVTVGVNIPLLVAKRKAAVEEARAMLASDRQHYHSVKNEVDAEIEDLYSRLKTSENMLTLYRHQLIPDAERTLQSVLAAYRTGALDFLSLLDSERILLNYHLEYTRELANYRKQAAALERAVGGKFVQK